MHIKRVVAQQAMSRHLYVAVLASDWDKIKEQGRLLITSHFHVELDAKMIEWLKGQFVERCGYSNNAFAFAVTFAPFCCHASAKDAYATWRHCPRMAILKIKVDADLALDFDDIALLSAMNGPLNEWNPGGIVCWSKEDWDLYDTSTLEEGLASCNRIFDFNNPERDVKWCDRPCIMTFVPELTREMVVSAKVYRYGIRVRRPLRFMKRTRSKL